MSPRLERLELAFALSSLGGALALNYRLSRAASELGERSAPVADSVLSLLPRVDTRVLFTWGFGGFLAALIVVALARERERLAWIAWSFALLISVRALCVLLTPLRSPAGSLWVGGDPLYEGIGRYLTFRHDLFFSSHTAMPFLAALLVRDRAARAAFYGASAVLAATVLLARLHYSIDVAAAYAFTWSVQHANRRWLRPAYRARRARLLEHLQEV